MLNASFDLLMFSAKAAIIVILLLILLAGIIALLSRGKESTRGKISIKNLNKKYDELTAELMEEVLAKKPFKKFMKNRQLKEKNQHKAEEKNPRKNIFVLNFNGDVKASGVTSLREEVSAILGIASSNDEVVVCLESAGGMVHAYGLAASQLQRIRNQGIPLTVTVDKVAASGGYLMASVANKILAAPFAIIGSIGVVVQIPNFHRLLKEKHIDFEQLTAGNFKRTLTIFGKNTEEGREKLQEEIEDIHTYFKNVIQQHRPVDIEKVATGEHWLAAQALELKLVDELMTSDDYLLSQREQANIFEVCYHAKKSLASKLFSSASLVQENLFEKPLHLIK